jgi:hypothetical protein
MLRVSKAVAAIRGQDIIDADVSLLVAKIALDSVPPKRLAADLSMGFLNVRDGRGDPSNEGWEYLGEARGTITGPALKELRLWVSLDASRDLSPLASLEPSSP